MLVDLFRRFAPKSRKSAEWREKTLVEAAQLREAGDVSGAIEKLNEVLERYPGELRALNDLGACFAYVGRARDAERVFELAYSLDDTFVAAIVNHARVLLDQKRGAEAMPFLRRAKIAEPESLQSDAIFAAFCMAKGEADRGSRYHLRAWMADFDSLRHANGYLWNLAYRDIPEHLGAAEHRFWAETAAPAADGEKPFVPAPPEGRRVRIGYLSPDFRNHSVRFFFRPLLESHDRERFEVFVYHDSPVSDAQTEHVRNAAEHFHDVSEVSDAALVDLVRSHQLDVLVELAGHTSYNRLHLFQRRFATVQMTALGDPSTTGSSGLDAKLLDTHTVGPEPERHYSEAPAVMPGSFWCFDPLEPAPEPGPPPVLAKGHVTFGCAGNVAKINTRMLAAWKRVLERVEGSRLLVRAINFLDAESLKATRARFEAAGMPMERVEFLLPANDQALYESYHDIDVILDTYPFNGGTTSCFALFMGVPIVSLYGQALLSRMGLSVLASMGAPQLAVTTLDEYVERAVSLARDVDFCTQFRASARERLHACSLGNGSLFAREFERTCEALLEKARAGGLQYETRIPQLPADELVRRAYAVARHGRPEAAQRIADYCLRLYPDNGDAHLLRAQQMEEPGQAIAYLLEQGERLGPPAQAAMLMLALRLEMLRGRTDAAVALLRRVEAQDVPDAFDRAQLALYRCALVPADAIAAPQLPPVARRVLIIVPCEEPERFEAVRRQVQAVAECPQGWSMDFERCREHARADAYQAALGDAEADIVVLMQKNVEVHNPHFLLEVAASLADADVVGFAGARRWARMDWRADEQRQKAACFLSASRESVGLVDVNLIGADPSAHADGMAVLDGALLAARAGLPAQFDEDMMGSHALLEEYWTYGLAQAGHRLRVNRNLGILVDAAVPLDTSSHADARVRCADLLELDPFPPADEDMLLLSVPTGSAAEAARVAAAFLGMAASAAS